MQERTRLWNAITSITGGLYRDGFVVARDDVFDEPPGDGGNRLFTNHYWLGADNAFRFNILHNRVVVARTAGRLLMSLGEDDFVRHLVGLDGSDRIQCLFPPLPQGIVSYGGTTWVHPDYRGHGLAQRLLWLMRYVAVLDFGVVAHIGHCRTEELARKLFGPANPVQHSADLFVGDQAIGELYLGWVTRDEIVANVDKTNPVL